MVNGNIFVVRAEQDPMDGIKESIATLEKVGANIIGFVYNDAEKGGSYRKYKYTMFMPLWLIWIIQTYLRGLLLMLLW